MSQKKKKARADFRNEVFKRDGYKCVFCPMTIELDAHHITDRTEMENGGYVKENGITVCKDHHILCELFHSTGKCRPEYRPEALYGMIGSSYEMAKNADAKNG